MYSELTQLLVLVERMNTSSERTSKGSRHTIILLSRSSFDMPFSVSCSLSAFNNRSAEPFAYSIRHPHRFPMLPRSCKLNFNPRTLLWVLGDQFRMMFSCSIRGTSPPGVMAGIPFSVKEASAKLGWVPLIRVIFLSSNTSGSRSFSVEMKFPIEFTK